MPAAFISHGAAGLTIEKNSRTQLWADFGHRITRPSAIVVISAHWFIHASAVTAMERPRTVHDFFYPPGELYEFTYPAPGDPALAQRIVELARPKWVGMDFDSWGIDHGAYSVLAHAFPAADIPVLELSVHASAPFRYHLELATTLDPLRDEGVLLLASGTLVHNRRAVDDDARRAGRLSLAQEFVSAVADQLQSDPFGADALERHRGYALCSPTPDHFLPLLYLAGLAAASGDPVTVPFDDSWRGLGPNSFAIGLGT